MTNTSASLAGTLYIVATPIGNKDDITLRALSTLRSVDAILAEDTRHSGQFLTTHGIKNKLISLHMHNEEAKCAELLDELLNGRSFALISDAGTPLISDPGYLLVKYARERGITVTPIPGACALIAALSAAGIACDSFRFYGFLPIKSSARQKFLEKVSHCSETVVFYESTHRIIESIADLIHILGAECQIILVKELTKQFERFITGTTLEVQSWLAADSKHSNGEFVILIPPRQLEKSTDQSILKLLLSELPLKQAVKIASILTNIPKNSLYKQALDLTEE